MQVSAAKFQETLMKLILLDAIYDLLFIACACIILLLSNKHLSHGQIVVLLLVTFQIIQPAGSHYIYCNSLSCSFHTLLSYLKTH
ncbi:hypothetical protein BJX61DRAFT_76930 [Aspergillus egyptiacus]|nr:hypothetical protein BJX61DRAFT_76930 [Aspergillus egyptiacus]